MKTRWRPLVWTAVVCSLAWVGFPAAAQDRPKTDEPKKTEETKAYKVGDHVKAFTLTDVNGKKVNLSDYKDRVILLHFFAKDAGEELGMIQKDPYEKHKKDGLVVLAITTEEKGDVAKTVEKAGVTYPVLLDANGEVSKVFGVTKAPQCVVVGHDMKIVHLQSGGDPKDVREKIESALEAGKKKSP